MYVEHQVLKVCIDTCLSINGCLLIGQEVVELYDSNCYCFKLLSFEHDLLKYRVFDDLVSDYSCKMSSFRHVPPIITIKRSIAVVPQALQMKSQLNQHSTTYLKDLIQFLFFKYSIFQVYCNLLLPSHFSSVIVLIICAIAKCILIVKSVDDWDSTLGELAFHKQLTILTTLSPQFNLTTVSTLKIIC